MHTVQQLWQMEMDQLQLEQGRTPDEGMWRWSPLDLYAFDAMLAVAHEVAEGSNVLLRQDDQRRQLWFAEAGCGIGTKLYLAKQKYGLKEYGYEIDDDYLARCHELEVNVERRDLRDVPSPPWAMYDIVYIARPFKEDAEEVAWERSVMEGMRPGAVLISAYAAVKPYAWPCYYRKPFRGVWVKGGTIYNTMIQRIEPHDPLVQEPGPG